MRLFPCLLLVFLALATPASAQSFRQFIGTVTAPNGNPLPGVNVKVLGHQPTSTNHDGQFYVNDRLEGETLGVEISPRPRVDGNWTCPNSEAPQSATIGPEENARHFTVSTVREVDQPDTQAEEQTFVELLNQARAEAGRTRLSGVVRLHGLAAVQATTMDIYRDRAGEYSHLGFLCERMDTRAAEIGLKRQALNGASEEVVTWRQPSAKHALDWFRSSPEHWRVLMESGATQVGVGQVNRHLWAVVVSNGRYTLTGPELAHRRTMPSAWAQPSNPQPPNPQHPPPPTPDPDEDLRGVEIYRPQTVTAGRTTEIYGAAPTPTVSVRIGETTREVKVEEGQWSLKTRVYRQTRVVATAAGREATAVIRVRARIKARAERQGRRLRVSGSLLPKVATSITATVKRRGRTTGRFRFETRRDGSFDFLRRAPARGSRIFLTVSRKRGVYLGSRFTVTPSR